MAVILRQSTQIVVRIGPAVAVADGFTPVTTLTLSGADEAEVLRAGTATLDISAATFAAVTGADGWYDLTLTTTATNTVGELVIVVNDDSLILPLYAVFQVVEEAVYDRDWAAAATGLVTLAAVTHTGATIPTVTTTGTATAVTTVNGLAANVLTAAATATDFGTEVGTAVWASTTRVLTANTNLNDPSAATIADAVLDEVLSGHVTVGTAGQRLAQKHAGTAQAGAAGTITLASGAVATDDYYNSDLVHITAGTGVGQSRVISDYVGSTLVATVSGTWAVTPDNTSVYQVLPGGAANISGTVSADVLSISGDTTAADTMELFAEALDQATGQLDSGSLAAGTLTATAIAGDAITAAKLAADVTTELQSGLATSAALATVDGLVDTLIAAVINLATKTGTVTTDAGNSATSFETDLSESVNDYWKDSFLLITSGALVGQQKKITAYNGTTKIITVSGGFTGTPADAVTFAIVNR